MKIKKTPLPLMALITAGMLLGACSPEVGSEAWCKSMKEKPKGEWTANEAGDFAKNCMFNRQ